MFSNLAKAGDDQKEDGSGGAAVGWRRETR